MRKWHLWGNVTVGKTPSGEKKSEEKNRGEKTVGKRPRTEPWAPIDKLVSSGLA